MGYYIIMKKQKLGRAGFFSLEMLKQGTSGVLFPLNAKVVSYGCCFDLFKMLK